MKYHNKWTYGLNKERKKFLLGRGHTKWLLIHQKRTRGKTVNLLDCDIIFNANELGNKKTPESNERFCNDEQGKFQNSWHTFHHNTRTVLYSTVHLTSVTKYQFFNANRSGNQRTWVKTWGWRKYFPIYEEAVSHIWLCNCSIRNFLIYEENFTFFFISVGMKQKCR